VAVFRAKPRGIFKIAYFHNFTLTILHKQINVTVTFDTADTEKVRNYIRKYLRTDSYELKRVICVADFLHRTISPTLLTYSLDISIITQRDGQCSYNVTLMRVRVTNVAVGKQ